MSGANNPIWIIRDGKIEETKPDKQAIGKTDNLKPFKTHNFELNRRLIYISQMAFKINLVVIKEKNLSYKFQKIITSIITRKWKNNLNINNSFEEWRGNQDQVDDICIIGVRI